MLHNIRHRIYDHVYLALCQRAVAEYNYDHPHSSLAMLSPMEFTSLLKQGLITVTKQNTIEILTHAA